MPTFLLEHQHEPRDCAVAVAAWRGFASPELRGRAWRSCAAGGHRAWFVAEAPDPAAAIALLPPWLHTRTRAVAVEAVPIR